jgi:Zn-finger nucleic acid-binding protein
MSDYRAGALRCPACGHGLDEVGAGESLVDVCRHCRGIYLDWLDGEPRELVRHVVTPLGGSVVGAEPRKLEGACPRCAVPFVAELYQSRGPWVHRCSGCQGIFVDFAAAEVLADTSGPEDYVEKESGPLSRLGEALRALVGA